MNTPDPGCKNPKGVEDTWDRCQKSVIQLLVLALKIISAVAIIAIFAIAEYGAVKKVAHALGDPPVGAGVPAPPCGCRSERKGCRCRGQATAMHHKTHDSTGYRGCP